ncbi:DUF6716 putative glycosyltransferase, partial [Agromyces seonyuensis]|nr:hypothetical protein [Agromyces seonyuensis]
GWDGGGYRHAMPVAAEPGADVVFAVQAKCPAGIEDRELLVERLAEAAAADPSRRVVVKVRARAGEAQTHAETFDLGDLVGALGERAPANLVVADGPMDAALAGAGALVTVSSTAALEALARGLPVLLLDDWGVSDRMINTVFTGSGLFGSTSELVEGRFRRPRITWLADNYFHGAAADDWMPRLDALADLRDAGGLRKPVRRHGRAGGALRRAWERKLQLGDHDRSLTGSAAYALGVPARGLVRGVRRLRRRLEAPVATTA